MRHVVEELHLVRPIERIRGNEVGHRDTIADEKPSSLQVLLHNCRHIEEVLASERYL
jgi:hypothetical protein